MKKQIIKKNTVILLLTTLSCYVFRPNILLNWWYSAHKSSVEPLHVHCVRRLKVRAATRKPDLCDILFILNSINLHKIIFNAQHVNELQRHDKHKVAMVQEQRLMQSLA